MKTDKEKTDVIFLYDIDTEKNEVFAYFPNEPYQNAHPNVKTCYAHIGQHSACDMEYAAICEKAAEGDYLPLKRELEAIGYNLNVL